MAQLIPNEFSSYALSENEQLEGAILTILQKQVLHNDLAMYAAEKLALDINTNSFNEYVQAEAYVKGQIDVLRHILAKSDAAAEVLYPSENPTQSEK